MRNELHYVKLLEDAGLSREEAALHLKVVEGAMKDNVSTKLDLHEVRSELKLEIQEVRAELKQEIQEVRTELKQEIQEVRTELKQEIQEVRTELKQEIQEVRADIQDLRSDFKNLELRIVNKMGVMTATSVTLLSGVAALFKFAF